MRTQGNPITARCSKLLEYNKLETSGVLIPSILRFLVLQLNL